MNIDLFLRATFRSKAVGNHVTPKVKEVKQKISLAECGNPLATQAEKKNKFLLGSKIRLLRKITEL